jgi:CRISPR/Cas system-associated exonuclease Cas4 (RecB family)
MFFASYLCDRIIYNYKLKNKEQDFSDYIEELAESDNKLLNTGENISLQDIEVDIMMREEKLKKEGIFGERGIDYSEKKNGKIIIPRGGYSLLIDNEINEESPILRGETLHDTHSATYPKIRWNFNWRNYVVVGIPDGITEKLVYEFKSTENKFLSYFQKPIAKIQADLYGYFFKRNKKKVEIYIIDENKIETWQEKVNKNKAINTLKKFKALEEGDKPIPPKKWKCKICKFKDKCYLLNGIKWE